MMYKSQFRKMDPYGFVVQGHILCLIYQNIISAFVTEAKCIQCPCKYIYATSDEASVFPLHCKDEFC